MSVPPVMSIGENASTVEVCATVDASLPGAFSFSLTTADVTGWFKRLKYL